MKIAGTLAVGIGLAVLLTGCTDVGGMPIEGAPAQPLDPDLVAVVPPQTVAMDALLTGDLVITGDCVYIRADYDPASPLVLPVFPDNIVAWAGDGVLSINGHDFRDGDRIEIGGGFVREPTSPYELHNLTHVPDGCGTDYVYVFAIAPDALTR